MPPKRKWSTSFSNINNVSNVSRQREPFEDLGVATHKKPNFEDSLFFLDTPMLENRYMSEPGFEYFDQTNRDPETKSKDPRVHDGTNLDASMSCILQRVKRIREIVHFLTKQDPNDQLSFEGTPKLLQTSQFEQDEKTPSSLLIDDRGPSDYKLVDPCLSQDCPTFPLTEEDIDWGDCPNDTFDISKDWDDYCHTQGDGYMV
jgi:hypothetical protein